MIVQEDVPYTKEEVKAMVKTIHDLREKVSQLGWHPASELPPMLSTSIEQSKRLLELGLDPESADMEYCYIDEFNSGLQVKGDINAEVDRRLDVVFGVTHIPAWSLSALLEVMPITITKDGMEHKLKVFPSGLFSTHSDTSKWTVQYCGIDYSYRARDKYPILVAVTQYDLIDAAYEMVCWLLENNLITNN